MPRLILLLTLATAALSAAVLRGTIVENRTGKPLSRATVTLTPIAGTPGNPVTQRTDRFGGFAFQSLAPGLYVLKSSQRGFLPLEYGQKLWNSAGQPVVVNNEAIPPFLQLRMFRYGGITGSIVDENDIGMWGHDVVAYRNTQPPQVATRTTSDDRGTYRLSSLEPGVYLVRTAGTQDEQISYVPTFSKETREVANARIVQVFPDEDSAGMDIRPAPGTLLTISVEVDIDLDYCPADLTLTLASEMGRQTVTGLCGFRFGSLPPGPYEVYAESKSVLKSGYLELSIAKDTGAKLIVRDTPLTPFQILPYSTGSAGMQFIGRRKDLAGVGAPSLLQLVKNSVQLARGRWEVMLIPTPGNYVSSFYAYGLARGTNRPDGWNEFVANGSPVRFTVSGGASEMHGIVKYYGDPAPGVPVFLEAWDPDTRKRVSELRTVRTDTRGNYRFQGLAPGVYRILSTFEYQMPDSAAMDLAVAKQVRVEVRSDPNIDLDLYGIR